MPTARIQPRAAGVFLWRHALSAAVAGASLDAASGRPTRSTMYICMTRELTADRNFTIARLRRSTSVRYAEFHRFRQFPLNGLQRGSKAVRSVQ